MPDARVDAAFGAADARPADAASPPDAIAIVFDASPNCPGGSDPGCTSAALGCASSTTQVRCEMIAPGCFKQVAGTALACSSNKACVVGSGCVCEAQVRCDAPGNGGRGVYCGTAGSGAASPQDRYTCVDRADDDDECIVPVDSEDCPAPSVCSEDVAGQASCGCPAPAMLPGGGCSQLGVEMCSGDGGSLIRCELQNAGGLNCNVWTVRDDCATDELRCENSACVCPATTNQRAFFANPVVDRSKRPGLLPTGVRFPPQCTMPLLGQAVALATAEGLDGFFPTYAVASDDGAPAGTTEVVFREEMLPLVIPDNVTVTTIDHPNFSYTPPPPIRDHYFKIAANSYAAAGGAGPDGFVWLRGRDDEVFPDHPGPSLIGFEVDVEPCRFDPALGKCGYPLSVVYATGYGANAGGTQGRPNLHRVVVDGSSSGIVALAQPAVEGQPRFPAFDGVLSAGTITANSDDGSFTYQAPSPDDDDPRWVDGFFAPVMPACPAESDRVLRITGAANPGNDGVFPVVPGGDADTITAIGRGTVDETLPATATITLYCLLPGSFPRDGLLVENANGVFEQITVTGFLSGVPRSRAGARIESVFDDKGVVFSGGSFLASDVGLFVDETVGADTLVSLAPAGNLPPLFDGNLDAGLLARKPGCGEARVVLTASGLTARGTFRQTFENPFGLGAGHGVVIDGLPSVTLTASTVSGNAQDGVRVETDLGSGESAACTGSPGAVVLEGSTLSGNGFNGLGVHDFFGTIEVRGGAITGNGTDLGVRDFDPGEAADNRVYAVGNGVRIDGCVSGPGFEGQCKGGFFIADLAGERPQIATNTLSGLRAASSSIYVTAADFTGNGTANKCVNGRPTADARDAAIVASRSPADTGYAVLHLDGVKVAANQGTGIRIGAGLSVARASTIAASEVTGNLGRSGCAFDPREPAFAPPFFAQALGVADDDAATVTIGAGIHVRGSGHLQVVNGATRVSGNGRHGIYDSGRIDLFFSRSTELEPNDPSAETDGTWWIESNGWNGLYVSTYAGLVEVSGGTISGNGTDADPNAPHEGVHIAGDKNRANDVTVSGSFIEDNAGDGVVVDTADVAPSAVGLVADKVRLTEVSVRGNGKSGIRVLAAPGTSPQSFGDVPLEVTSAMYGFTLDASEVMGNAGEGVVIGRPTAQAARVLAMIGGPQASNRITANGGAGVLLQGGPAVGATLAANVIRDNSGAGFELGSAVIVPLFVDGALEVGLGFISNLVSHNAMVGAGCDAPQSRAQIYITAPTAMPPGPCPGASNADKCHALNETMNQHCMWTGSSCVRAHDLKGDLDPMCATGLRNSIYDYNTSDSSSDSVGARAVGSSFVDLDNNEWETATTSQNVTQGAGSFIQAASTCSVRSCSP